jgi:hypothetical protein
MANAVTEQIATETVVEIGKINFTGNIIPHAWYQHVTQKVKTKNGIIERTDSDALLVLAEIIYWYRPRTERDEQSGQITGIYKRFKADKLQKSYRDFTRLLGLSVKQVRAAIKTLVNLGLIKAELRTVVDKGMTYANVMFVEPVVEAIARISVPKALDNSTAVKKSDLSPYYAGDIPAFLNRGIPLDQIQSGIREELIRRMESPLAANQPPKERDRITPDGQTPPPHQANPSALEGRPPLSHQADPFCPRGQTTENTYTENGFQRLQTKTTDRDSIEKSRRFSKNFAPNSQSASRCSAAIAHDFFTKLNDCAEKEAGCASGTLINSTELGLSPFVGLDQKSSWIGGDQSSGTAARPVENFSAEAASGCNSMDDPVDPLNPSVWNFEEDSRGDLGALSDAEEVENRDRSAESQLIGVINDQQELIPVIDHPVELPLAIDSARVCGAQKNIKKRGGFLSEVDQGLSLPRADRGAYQVCQSNVIEAEIIDESPSLVENKAISNRKGKILMSQEICDRFRECWNQFKPELFTKWIGMNDERKRLIRKLIESWSGNIEKAFEALSSALLEAKETSWFATRALSVENFFSNNKVMRLYEQYINRVEEGKRSLTDIEREAVEYSHSQRCSKVKTKMDLEFDHLLSHLRLEYPSNSNFAGGSSS